MNEEIVYKILDSIYKEGEEGLEGSGLEAIKNCLKKYCNIEYLHELTESSFLPMYHSGYFGYEVDKESIVQVLQQKLGHAINLFDEQTIINRIPPYIKNILLSYPSMVLAGGSVLKIILNKAWEGDWDIFHSNFEKFKDLDDCLLKLNNDVISNTGDFDNIGHDDVTEYSSLFGLVYTGNTDFGKIQFISGGTELVVDNFDLTICQFSIRNINGQLRLNATTKAVDALIKMELVYNPESRSGLSNVRLEKYLGRGFQMNKELATSIGVTNKYRSSPIEYKWQESESVDANFDSLLEQHSNNLLEQHSKKKTSSAVKPKSKKASSYTIQSLSNTTSSPYASTKINVGDVLNTYSLCFDSPITPTPPPAISSNNKFNNPPNYIEEYS